MKQLNYDNLTVGQLELIRMVIKWYNSKDGQVFAYSGLAGTGKTYVLPFIIQALGISEDNVIFCAYTGKAASNLVRKGFDAKTIHSIFYDLVEEERTVDGEVQYKNGRVMTDLRFKEKDFIDPHCKLIVLDEFSMVNEDLHHAMAKHGIPILACGDMHQLRPVIGESPFQKYVQYELKEIMRQNADNGIVQLAHDIMVGKDIPYYRNYGNNAWVMHKHWVMDKELSEADCILCGRNKTRDYYNSKLRDMEGYTGKLPHLGERLICRKNDWRHVLEDGTPLINGTSGRLIMPIDLSTCDFKRNIYRCDFQPDFSTDYFENLKCDLGFLNSSCANKVVDEWNRGVKLEYAYALTVHLSQGSEYPFVIYIDEPSYDKAYTKELRYTAVTRATNKILFLHDFES